MGYKRKSCSVCGEGLGFSEADPCCEIEPGDEVVVWAVRYGNYFPVEIDSIFKTKELAEQEIERKGWEGEWQACGLIVRTEAKDDG